MIVNTASSAPIPFTKKRYWGADDIGQRQKHGSETIRFQGRPGNNTRPKEERC